MLKSDLKYEIPGDACFTHACTYIQLGPAYVALASRQNWRQLVVISAYVDALRKFALIGNFRDTVDWGRKRA